MTTRPIIMSAESVRAILDGRKTQTRWVMKKQPPNMPGIKAIFNAYDGHGLVFSWPWRDTTEAGSFPPEELPAIRCPYGVPGDRLWVRETWQHECGHCEDCRCGNPDHIFYRATDPAPETFASWRPSIHMPRWASRLTLEIVSVRAERLQEISESDAKAEGVDYGLHLLGELRECTARWQFMKLWNTINAKRGHPWDSNPWVWAIEFRPVESAERSEP